MRSDNRDRIYRVCPGCKATHRAKKPLCRPCAKEVEYGLYGGRWIVRSGVRVWQPAVALRKAS